MSKQQPWPLEATLFPMELPAPPAPTPPAERKAGAARKPVPPPIIEDDDTDDPPVEAPPPPAKPLRPAEVGTWGRIASLKWCCVKNADAKWVDTFCGAHLHRNLWTIKPKPGVPRCQQCTEAKARG